ncbi:MAG: tetratricopeptide repeat protein [Treponema sp.]|nr:tetratricopeptide repeat protein [Treponema sp.]
MKKCLCFSFVCLLIFFISCSSSAFQIPGEKKVILKNLATEYYTIAEGYMEIKNYTKAAEYYKLAMRNEDLYLAAYYKLARSYALAKNWDEATKYYEDLLEKDSENTMLKTTLAYITAMRGNTDEAIIMYKNLIEKNPYDETLLESYVALLIFVGRGEDAEKSFFILKEKFPDNKQLNSFAQQLDEIVDNFDADKKVELPPEEEGNDKIEKENAKSKKS